MVTVGKMSTTAGNRPVRIVRMSVVGSRLTKDKFLIEKPLILVRRTQGTYVIVWANPALTHTLFYEKINE